MKTFKNFITEKVAWLQSASKMIWYFNNIYDMKIPITSKTMSWLFDIQLPRATVFHVTDEEGLKNLKKLQNKKKSISAFFNMDTPYLNYGIKTGGGIVVELDANVIMSSHNDILSRPDKTGRRWVELHNIDPKEKMHKEFEKMLIDLAIKHDPGKDDFSYKQHVKWADDNGLDVWWLLQRDVQGDGKKKSLIIADYIDEVNTILKKHKKEIQGAIQGYIVRRGTVAVKQASGKWVGGDSEKDEWSAWDEQVVDQIKIEKVHTFTTETKPAEWVKDSVVPLLDKIPHKHWKTVDELSKYIKQVAEAEVKTFFGWAKNK